MSSPRTIKVIRTYDSPSTGIVGTDFSYSEQTRPATVAEQKELRYKRPSEYVDREYKFPETGLIGENPVYTSVPRGLTEEELDVAKYRERGENIAEIFFNEAAALNNSTQNALDARLAFDAVQAREAAVACFVTVSTILPTQVAASFVGSVANSITSVGAHLAYNGAYCTGVAALAFACGPMTYVEVSLRTNGQLRPLNQIITAVPTRVIQLSLQNTARMAAGEFVPAIPGYVVTENQVASFICGMTRNGHDLACESKGFIATFTPSEVVGNVVAPTFADAYGITGFTTSLANSCLRTLANIPGQLAGGTTAMIADALMSAMDRNIDAGQPPAPSEVKMRNIVRASATTYVSFATMNAFNTAAMTVGASSQVPFYLAVVMNPAFFVPTVVALGTGVVGYRALGAFFRRAAQPVPEAPAAVLALPAPSSL